MLWEELKRKDKLYHSININTLFLAYSIPVSFCKYAFVYLLIFIVSTILKGRDQRGFKYTERKPFGLLYLGVTHNYNEFRSSEPHKRKSNQYYGGCCEHHGFLPLFSCEVSKMPISVIPLVYRLCGD
jgi:hypothetical protein